MSVELSGIVVTSGSDFTFIAPSIASFTPTTARIGDVITIMGIGFSASGNTVAFFSLNKAATTAHKREFAGLQGASRAKKALFINRAAAYKRRLRASKA